MSVYLVRPRLEDEDELREYAKELTSLEDGEGVNNLLSYLLEDLYPTWVSWTQNDNRDTFLIINDVNQIVGIINIRYKLSKALEKCGGHIGYNIRPSMRKKGYAKEALRQILPYAVNHGLDEVFIDCYKDNIASLKTIEAAGGVLLRDEYNELHDHQILRYKINLRELKLNDDLKESFLKLNRIPDARIVDYVNGDSELMMMYTHKRKEVKIRLALEYLKNLLQVNPNLSEDMISPDLVKYLGIAKREYKKEQIKESRENEIKR